MRHIVLKSISHPEYTGIVKGMLREKNLMRFLCLEFAPPDCSPYPDGNIEGVLINAAFSSFTTTEFLEFLPDSGRDFLLRFLESNLPSYTIDFIEEDEWEAKFGKGKEMLKIELAYEEQPPFDLRRVMPEVTA